MITINLLVIDLMSDLYQIYLTYNVGSGKCHELLRLGGQGKELASLIDPSQFERCIDHIGQLDWDPDTARILLDKIATFKVSKIIN
jgi:hypothetical protein